MNAPIGITSPHSFADRLADIRLLQQSAATATKALLTQHGWHHSRLNPAHCWLWSRKLPDGRTILTDLNTALAIEASLAGQSLPPAASQPVPHPFIAAKNAALAQPTAPDSGISTP